MHEELIKAQKDNSLTVNYNRWVFDTIRPYIGKRVLDVGAGCGNFTGMLAEGRETVVALEVLDCFVAELKRSYSHCPNVRVVQADIQEGAAVEAGISAGVDSVVCNNVLEHVADDRKALRNIWRLLPPSGRCVIVAPAFRFLHGRWDDAVGHFRRYDRRDIIERVSLGGFRLRKVFYFNMAGFFAWFLNSRILGNTPRRDFFVTRQAVFFDRCCVALLRRLEGAVKPPFGQSIVCVAEKAGGEHL